jgi:hypothetical protein
LEKDLSDFDNNSNRNFLAGGFFETMWIALYVERFLRPVKFFKVWKACFLVLSDTTTTGRL